MASTHRQQIRILKQQEQILKGIRILEERMAELSHVLQNTVPDTPAVAELEPELEPESKAPQSESEPESQPEPELTAKEKRDLAKAEKAKAKEEELFVAALAADNASSNLSG